MTREQIVAHVAAVITETVDGRAYYLSFAHRERRYVDYEVEVDEQSVTRAAEQIADWILTRRVESVETTP